MLHGLQHIGIGVTPHDMVNAIATAGAEANVHGVGCAEQVVQIAHHLLICTAEEQADQIGVVAVEFVQLQEVFRLSVSDEAIQSSIGIAGEVGEVGQSGRPLIQLLNGHHWKQLIDGPGVGS